MVLWLNVNLLVVLGLLLLRWRRLGLWLRLRVLG